MILIIGATGRTGSLAAKALAKTGVQLRALVRNETKAASLRDLGIEVVIGDLSDQHDVQMALEGAKKTLLITPNNEQQLSLERSFLDNAQEAGVDHIAYLSSTESVPENHRAIPQVHVEIENQLRKSNMQWTMIRPNFFMQNLFMFAPSIKKDGSFVFPAEDGKTAMADLRDVASVISVVLTTGGHENKSYDITGPELLTFYDVANQLTEALGKKIHYRSQSLEKYRAYLSGFLRSDWHLNAVCELMEEVGQGGLDYTTDTVRTVLGRDSTSLGQFLRDHISVFEG